LRVVAVAAHVGETSGFEQRLRGLGLAHPDLEGENTAGNEMIRRGVDDPAHEIEAVRSAVERETGLEVPAVGHQRFDLRRDDVRRVGGDDVELSGDAREEIAEGETDVVRAETKRVLAREGQRVGAQISRDDLRGRTLAGDGDGDATAAGAE